MMVGGDCSAADACWVVAQDALDVVAEDGTSLGSVFARDLLSYYARGKGMAHKGTEHLVKEELLDVLWAVDPHSFFFAYVDADARQAGGGAATGARRRILCAGDALEGRAGQGGGG